VGCLGLPEEIAGLIIYLCSDEAAFVTVAQFERQSCTARPSFRR